MRQNLVQLVIVAPCTVGAGFGLAFQIGFPIPFSLITTPPIWMVFMALAMVLTWGKHAREQGEALKKPITNAILVWTRQNTLVGIYHSMHLSTRWFQNVSRPLCCSSCLR